MNKKQIKDYVLDNETGLTEGEGFKDLQRNLCFALYELTEVLRSQNKLLIEAVKHNKDDISFQLQSINEILEKRL